MAHHQYVICCLFVLHFLVTAHYSAVGVTCLDSPMGGHVCGLLVPLASAVRRDVYDIGFW